jgi:hypothetical protein
MGAKLQSTSPRCARFRVYSRLAGCEGESLDPATVEAFFNAEAARGVSSKDLRGIAAAICREHPDLVLTVGTRSLLRAVPYRLRTEWPKVRAWLETVAPITRERDTVILSLAALGLTKEDIARLPRTALNAESRSLLVATDTCITAGQYSPCPVAAAIDWAQMLPRDDKPPLIRQIHSRRIHWRGAEPYVISSRISMCIATLSS